MFGKQSREDLIAQAARLQALNESLKSEVEQLLEDKRILLAQVEKLQTALISKEAPEFYRDNRVTQLTDPNWEKDKLKRETEQSILKSYASMVEDEQIIKTPEDLAMMFTRAVGGITPLSHTPENSES